MDRRKFVKYTGLAGLAASLIPASLAAYVPDKAGVLIQFPKALTQIRHGALNLPFAVAKKEMPLDWVLDVHQNIFLHNGFQRNLDQDMNVISIALKQEDNFEPLQVNYQKNTTSILWKENYIQIENYQAMHKLDIVDEQYTFYFGHLAKNTSLDFPLNLDSDYFVQVLRGKIKNESYHLDTDCGLGLLASNTSTQKFEAMDESWFMIIARA